MTNEKQRKTELTKAEKIWIDHSALTKICLSANSDWLCHFLRNGIVCLNIAIMQPQDADEMESSTGPDQTASSLVWVCTVCSD